MFNLFSWVTDLVETFTFYGGGKGGSSSSSTAKDFFGEGKRAPYEDLLSTLLLGGTIGGTEGYYTNGSGGGSNDPNGGHWESKNNGFGLTNRVWVPNSRGNSRGAGNQGAYVPGTPGMSIGDYIKQTPGYQFGMTQGQEAVERSFAASGFGNSGNQSIALQNYGNQYAGQALQQLIGNLMPASGAALSLGNNSQSQTTPAGMGGDIAGAVTSFALSKIFASDKNLKTNIKHINTINGIKIYSFNYIWSYLKSVGVMAQDLLEMPEYKHAVHTTNIGYVVDYSKLPI
jgi:hypothetical protein